MSGPGRPDDPILARRARAGKLAQHGKRIGYGLFLLAMALFAVGLLTEYTSAITTAIVAALLAGSAALAPAIVLGYAVRAAEREDRDHPAP